ncbi:MAG: hypothetical protein ACRDX9_06465 [Acidimicrobiia bacterium]
MRLTVTSDNGTYSGASPYSASGSLNVTAELNALSGSCTPNTTTADGCTITATGTGGLVISSGVGTGDPHGPLSGTDTLTINADNDPPDLAVTNVERDMNPFTGGCGSFSAANNGSAELVNVVLTNFSL